VTSVHKPVFEVAVTMTRTSELANVLTVASSLHSRRLTPLWLEYAAIDDHLSLMVTGIRATPRAAATLVASLDRRIEVLTAQAAEVPESHSRRTRWKRWRKELGGVVGDGVVG
jgi:hypothetical protein